MGANKHFKGRSEWRQWLRPDDIPSDPNETYKGKGWKDWGDWFGTGTVAVFNRKFRDFKSARKFVRSLKLKNQDQWREYLQGKMPNLETLPNDIPRDPSKTYKDEGWINWPNWLGTEWREFTEAREFARSLNLKSQPQWREYIKGERRNLQSLADDIPKTPDVIYKEIGWLGWPDWLGKKWREFTEARKFARLLNLKSQIEWRKYAKDGLLDLGPRPDDIPFNPDRAYEDKGWISWPDWLGKT